MLHYDQGGNNAAALAFFDHMLAQDVPFDVIGLSYYSFFHGPLTRLRDNVDDLATRYGKKIVIAESQYAWTLANGDAPATSCGKPSQLSRATRRRPAGSCRSYSDLLSILARVPAPPRRRAVLLGAGVDPRRRLGARRGHAERQPDAVRLHRARRCRRSGSSRARSRCAPATPRRALRGAERRELRGLRNVIGTETF